MVQMIAWGGLTAAMLAAVAVYVVASRSVETPAYSVVRADDDAELRQYPELTLAQITHRGTRRSAVQSGFSPLARYIFAKDRAGEKMAMTAPVIQMQTNDVWIVAFILPAGISAAEAPVPAGDVEIVTVPPRAMAAIRFSGVWSDARFNEATDRLQAWIRDAGLRVIGPVEYGYYNDPFTPAFLRRNEVLVPVALPADP